MIFDKHRQPRRKSVLYNATSARSVCLSTWLWVWIISTPAPWLTWFLRTLASLLRCVYMPIYSRALRGVMSEKRILSDSTGHKLTFRRGFVPKIQLLTHISQQAVTGWFRANFYLFQFNWFTALWVQLIDSFTVLIAICTYCRNNSLAVADASGRSKYHWLRCRSKWAFDQNMYVQLEPFSSNSRLWWLIDLWFIGMHFCCPIPRPRPRRRRLGAFLMQRGRKGSGIAACKSHSAGNFFDHSLRSFTPKCNCMRMGL